MTQAGTSCLPIWHCRNPCSWAQLQPPRGGSGPKHPRTLGGPRSPLPPHAQKCLLLLPDLFSLPVPAPRRSKVMTNPRCCHNLVRCVHTWGGADMPAPCCLDPLQILGVIEHRRESRGLKAAQCGPEDATLVLTTWALWTAC